MHYRREMYVGEHYREGDRFIGSLRKGKLFRSLPSQWKGSGGVSHGNEGTGRLGLCRVKRFSPAFSSKESVPVSSYQQAGIPVDVKRKIARLGINMLLKMIFVDNFVHADLHPGNILVQGADGLSKSQEARLQQVDVCDALAVAVTPAQCPLRLVLLDAGIVAELQATDLRNFRAVFMAVAMGQGQRVAELILHHARAHECKDVEGFKAEMARLVTQARKNTITLEKLQVSSLLSNVFKLLVTHKVKLESNFASIVFAIMVLEGLGRSLDPKLDILEAAKPFLLQGLATC